MATSQFVAWPFAVVMLTVIGSGCSPSTPPSEAPADTTMVALVPDTTPEPTSGPAALVAIEPQPAPQSGQVQISGSGFAGGERVAISVGGSVDPTSDLLPFGNATTRADGSFVPVTLTLPDELQSGPHALQAVGQTSARRASGTLWIRAPGPWLVLDNYDVPQYGDLGLIAGGFEPMDNVQISLEAAAGANGPGVALVTFTTDQAGNGVWTQVKLPRLSAGTYNLVLRGQAGAAELRREMHVTPLKPLVELSPWAGPPGSPVQLNVKGFAPGERVEISVAGNSGSQVTAQADEYGNLWGAGPIRIPQTAMMGALTLNLVGDESGAIATAEFKVLEPKPWLELTSYSGAPGGPVGFGGGGWIGGETVTIHMGAATNPTVAEGVADDNGWLKGMSQVYIPLDVTDNVIFVALGEQSHLISAATYSVIFPFGLHPTGVSTPQTR